MTIQAGTAPWAGCLRSPHGSVGWRVVGWWRGWRWIWGRSGWAGVAALLREAGVRGLGLRGSEVGAPGVDGETIRKRSELAAGPLGAAVQPVVPPNEMIAVHPRANDQGIRESHHQGLMATTVYAGVPMGQL